MSGGDPRLVGNGVHVHHPPVAVLPLPEALGDVVGVVWGSRGGTPDAEEELEDAARIALGPHPLGLL